MANIENIEANSRGGVNDVVISDILKKFREERPKHKLKILDHATGHGYNIYHLGCALERLGIDFAAVGTEIQSEQYKLAEWENT